MQFLRDLIPDWRKSRLFGPIIAMTLGGLALFVLVSLFLVSRFDNAAAQREQDMVAQGFERQIEEFETDLAPLVNWDRAVAKLDNQFDPDWADKNFGAALSTYGGISRAFVLDPEGRPLYASTNGEIDRDKDSYDPFAGVVANLLPTIRAAEARRPAIAPSTLENNAIVTKPIQATKFAWVKGQFYVVIASLVQPDEGKVLPRGARAPVVVTAMPVNRAMLNTLARRYMIDGIELVCNDIEVPGMSRVDLHDPTGKPLASLIWKSRAPGTLLFNQLKLPLLLALLMLAYVASVIMRRGAVVVNELIASESRARHLAYHDTLTSLPNRAMLFERLQTMLGEIRDGEIKVAVLCVDLDRFKEVNDTLGHHAGDVLISEVADRLRAVCDDNAIIARLGGDEFVVAVKVGSTHQTRNLAERILATVKRPVESEYGRLEVGCSIGAAVIDNYGVSASDALRWADLALYRSKDEGRMRATFFEPGMDAALRTRRSLETDLREALAKGGLELVYQPQVDHAGRMTAAEALLRWDHPERGPISPAVFVPLAEECGLMLGLGEFVLRRVFEETRDWDGLRVAINVSGVQIRSAGFAALVTRLAASMAIDPTRYEIELTESALLDEHPAIAGNIESLKRLGFTIALDDFGTGYSSMNILQRFPVDKIKIDSSFVGNLGANVEAEALIDAMVKLARALGLKVIAEGVETEAQKERLVACGCAEFQGYLTGSPVDAATIVGLAGVTITTPHRQVRRRG